MVFVHPGHPITCELARFVRNGLADHGYTVEEVSFRDPEALSRLTRLLTERAHEIFCFYSFNYTIKELALRNLWISRQDESIRASLSNTGELLLHQLTGIPLVVHVYDHPLYLLRYESSAFDGTIVYACGEDQIDFMQKHFRSRPLYVEQEWTTDRSLPSDAPDQEQFYARRNEILCPMNLSVMGVTADDFWGQIRRLPAARRDRSTRLIEAALYDCRTPLHAISERLEAEGDPEIEIVDLLPVLNFIKLWRRTEMVRALIDMPILISSDFVPSGLGLKYPQKFTSTSMPETLKLYSQFRFTLNSFPLMHYAMHDRLHSAFSSNSLVITDRNATTTRLFKDQVELVFFEYNGPDMAAKVRAYIENPKRAFQITQNMYERRMAGTMFSQGGYGNLIEAVRHKWHERIIMSRSLVRSQATIAN